jgi:hypothetical protein
VRIPSIQTDGLSHQQLLRSMNALMAHQAEVDECLATLLRPLIDVELSVIFYELTTIRTESPTLMPTLQAMLARLPHVRRLVVVADRSLLSIDNIEQMSALKMPDGQSIEFILAVPGRAWRSRTLSDSGAKARFFHEVCEANLARIVRVDLKSDLFSYDIDQRALARARLMDGKLLLVTNVDDLSAASECSRAKSRSVRCLIVCRIRSAPTRASVSWR